jgi:hypothetical protein
VLVDVLKTAFVVEAELSTVDTDAVVDVEAWVLIDRAVVLALLAVLEPEELTVVVVDGRDCDEVAEEV